MRRPDDDALVASGLGLVTAIGQGADAMTEALMAGRHAFGHMRRPGRQLPARGASPDDQANAPVGFIGAEIPGLRMPGGLSSSMLRTASLSGQAALAVLHEAWTDAALDGVDPARIGLVVGGSNLQQRELVAMQDAYRGRERFLKPSYGLGFMDTDLCGLCTEAFPIRGFAHTLGGASASGQAAVIHALEAVRSGRVDACIAIGGLMDLSYWECQGLRSLGAMGSDRYAEEPAAACRPFDGARDGFIFGESCAALVVERSDRVRARNRRPWAELAGWGIVMDGNRNPNPSLEGECTAITSALSMAGVQPEGIDYVNPHGTGSHIGDITEVQALRDSGLAHVRLNTTKSLIGHGLSAAGAVELAIVLLQMRAGRLHPARNLVEPIDPGLRWVGDTSEPHTIRAALNMSMGFGGINTAICALAC